MKIDAYKIAISCPSDMTAEKMIAKDAIAEVNSILEMTDGPQLRPRDWEKDSIGQVTSDAQSALNEQIFEQADLFLALIGDTIGSPTRREISGTVEEIRNAQNVQSEFSPNHLNVFFRENTSVRISELNLEQLQKRNAFRNELQKSQLTIDFSTDEELKEGIKRWLLTIFTKKKEPIKQESESQNDEEHQSEVSLIKSEHEEELEAMDYMEAFIKNASETSKKIYDVNDSVTALASFMEETNQRAEKAQEAGDFLELKQLIDDLGSRFSEDSETLGEKVDSLEGNMKATADSFDYLLLTVEPDWIGENEDFRGLLESLMEAKSGTAVFREAVLGGLDTVGKLPRATSKFNRGKKAYSVTLERLERTLHSFEKSTSDQIAFLKSLSKQE